MGVKTHKNEPIKLQHGSFFVWQSHDFLWVKNFIHQFIHENIWSML